MGGDTVRRNIPVGLMAGGLVLLSASIAPAQTGSGSSGSGFAGGSGGSFTGSSGSGFAGGFGGSSTGSSGSGFAGGSGGSFTGSSGSGFAGGTGGGFTGSSGLGTSLGGTGRTGQIGSGSVFGRYLGNPLAMGYASATSSALGSKYARTFPVTLSFGQALYNPTVTSSATLGSTALGNTANRYPGASSVGMRRAPGYLTVPGFDVPPRPTMAAVRSDLQSVIDRSSRLPSRGNIQVLSEGDTIVLRGQVASERERRLAEGLLRLSPGVRQIRNELRAPGGATKSP
jgi:osmotically-inducible protein OsmY